MANNVTVNGVAIATEDRSSVHFQKVKSVGAATAAATAMAVGTNAATALIFANTSRRDVALYNNSSVTVEVAPAAGFTFGTGWPIQAGGGLVIDYSGDLYFKAQTTGNDVRAWENRNT